MSFIYTSVVILIAATVTPGGCQHFKKGDTCLIHAFNKDSGKFAEAQATVVSIAAPDASQSKAEVLGIHIPYPMDNLIKSLKRENPGVFATKNTSESTNQDWVRLNVTNLNIKNDAVTISFSEFPTKVRCLLGVDPPTENADYLMSYGIINEKTGTIKLENGNIRNVEEVTDTNEFHIKEAIPNADWKKIFPGKRIIWLVVSFDSIPSAGEVLNDDTLGKCLVRPLISDSNNLTLEFDGTLNHGLFLPLK